ncbi:MAG: alpha-galactosidase [Anaerolineales bacterium]|nr:alpha-galactosidase [Anaerolineales bacterium]
MNISFQIVDMQFSLIADKFRPVMGGMILSGANVSLRLPFQPKRYYRHGWQSWSLAAWLDPSRPVLPINPPLIRPQADDPAYILSKHHGGSWLGGVDAPDGDVVLLAALGLDAHVELDGQMLRGWYEQGNPRIISSTYPKHLDLSWGNGEWFVANGPEQAVFAHYVAWLSETLGKGHSSTAASALRLRSHRPDVLAGAPPRVWCSWYSLYTGISEERLLNILKDLGDLPFDVFQIDDGWQKAIGDWEANEKFPSGMDNFAARIRATSRTPGLWLAPLLAVPSSSLFRQHPDWLLHDEKGGLVSAGFNWNEPLYALDTTHPAALDWLATLMKKVRAWGYDYLKLDFLYAGALPGKRHKDMPREAAYRHGLKVLREAMGEAYFLTCGAPILPSLGLCDGMRVGPDVASAWNNPSESDWLYNFSGLGTRNAIRTSLNRLWLGPLVHTDPDVVYFRTHNNRMTHEQTQLLQDLSLITGYKATSDLPSWLTPTEREALREFLNAKPSIQRTGRYTFLIDDREVDFSETSNLPTPVPRWFGELWSWLASSPTILRARNWYINRMASRNTKYQ